MNELFPSFLETRMNLRLSFLSYSFAVTFPWALLVGQERDRPQEVGLQERGHLLRFSWRDQEALEKFGSLLETQEKHSHWP